MSLCKKKGEKKNRKKKQDNEKERRKKFQFLQRRCRWKDRRRGSNDAFSCKLLDVKGTVQINDTGHAEFPWTIEKRKAEKYGRKWNGGNLIFKFRTDSCAARSNTGDMKASARGDEMAHFKTCPIPDFSYNKSIPLRGRTPPTRKALTTPQPFRYNKSHHPAAAIAQRERKNNVSNDNDNNGASTTTFHARPILDFSRVNKKVRTRTGRIVPIQGSTDVEFYQQSW